MWTSFYNFLCNKFFHWPEIGFRRSSNGSCDGIYGKRLKLIGRIKDSNGILNHTRSNSMQKENVEISDNEEDCFIIAEIPRRKKPGNSITVQTPTELTEPTKPVSREKFFSSFIFHSKPPDKSLPSETLEVKTPTKDVQKIPSKKFFTTQRACLSHGKLAKSKLSFRNNLKKKLNFLQESYRLTEKFQYIQLLQSQTFNFATLRNSFKNNKNVEKAIEIIDISDEKEENEPNKSARPERDEQDIQILGEFPCAKSFQDILKIRPFNSEIAIKEIPSNQFNDNADIVELPDKPITLIDVENIDLNHTTDVLEEKLRNFMQITTPEIQVCDNRGSYELPELTFEQEKKVRKALIAEPKLEVLSEGFGLKITRQDMQTLVGLNWLNDEIINFYMNLISERSRLNNKLPKVYAFNTFFYPKLASEGYGSLKRWTKKVDIFSFDLILVPIHLGMHWCLSIIDFRSRSVRYYDSIGSPNDLCLENLIFYLKAESLDKRNKIFPTSNWRKINVQDIPQQMNGGDCGVFSCMFAEHLARNCDLLFTQHNMPYFRKKMVIEILDKKLLT